jgi:integrase
MSVKAKSQVVCPDCRYRQKGEKKVCAKCKRSLKGVDRSYWVFVDHLGKKKAKKVGTRDAALEVAKKLEARLTLGDVGFLDDAPKTPTFQECAEQWYETYVKPNLSASTHKAYRRVLKKHAYPHMGTLRLDQIKRKHIRDLIAEKKGAGLSRDTVAQITSVCSAIFSHAIEDGLVEVSPVSNMGKFNRRPPEVETPVRPFPEEELDTFLGKLQEHWSFYHPLFFTLAKTGIRIGEAMALDWPNVDFQDRSLLVERS